MAWIVVRAVPTCSHFGVQIDTARGSNSLITAIDLLLMEIHATARWFRLASVGNAWNAEPDRSEHWLNKHP